MDQALLIIMLNFLAPRQVAFPEELVQRQVRSLAQ